MCSKCKDRAVVVFTVRVTEGRADGQIDGERTIVVQIPLALRDPLRIGAKGVRISGAELVILGDAYINARPIRFKPFTFNSNSISARIEISGFIY